MWNAKKRFRVSASVTPASIEAIIGPSSGIDFIIPNPMVVAPLDISVQGSRYPVKPNVSVIIPRERPAIQFSSLGFL